MAKHTLYLSFDGLSDPLGQSQIIPYLTGIAKNGYTVTVISCEKPGRFEKQGQQIQNLLNAHKIGWRHIVYDEQGGFFSRIQYSRELYRIAKYEFQKNGAGLVHCRSYLAALAGLRLKRKYAIPFVFDMRGLWADERRDGGIWSSTRPLHVLMYKFFKRKEKDFLIGADQIISLTEAGLQALENMYPKLELRSKATIIPCCTNTEKFDPEKTKAIVPPGLPQNTHLLVYTGSIGTWYMTREMIDCVLIWKKKLPELKLLILTNDQNQLKEILDTCIPEAKEMIVILSAQHNEVPGYLKAAKAAIFFIKPAFSKKASSPTKMAECWAMGLPVVTNAGIGDNDLFFQNEKAGVLVRNFDAESYELALEKYLNLKTSAESCRNIALQSFDTRTAVARYTGIYDKVWRSK